VETSKDAHVPRKPLALVVQLPELPQLDLAQRRPTAEEQRHSLVTIVPRIAKLGVVQRREVPRKALDHLDHRQRPHAPAPYGAFAGGLLPSCPSHFRILADRLRVTCISTSLPPPSAQWPVRSTRKERLGKRNGSRSRGSSPTPRAQVVAVLVSWPARGLVRGARFNHPRDQRRPSTEDREAARTTTRRRGRRGARLPRGQHQDERHSSDGLSLRPRNAWRSLRP
jgi:hypothetical protein